MVAEPNDDVVLAWARLVRAQGALVTAVEADLKAAGFPTLAWYDALLELSRSGEEPGLRPRELERRMLLPQYGTSRLIDRLERAGLAVRGSHPIDRRGQVVAITDAGRELRARMWPAYAASIQRHVGAKLGAEDAPVLASILAKLIEGTHPTR